jgi:hypothetical protein
MFRKEDGEDDAHINEFKKATHKKEIVVPHPIRHSHSKKETDHRMAETDKSCDKNLNENGPQSRMKEIRH